MSDESSHSKPKFRTRTGAKSNIKSATSISLNDQPASKAQEKVQGKAQDQGLAQGSDVPALEEKSLEKMEALLRQSALGVHVLFDNEDIANAMSPVSDNKDFFDFDKMKRVQDVMTELIAKPTYLDKVYYLRDLDTESYHMLIRTYFHIVENTVRATSEHQH